MTDRLLDKYTRRAEVVEPISEPETEVSEDFGCFGWLRGIRDRALMLELRKKDGHCLAVSYSWFESVEYDPDKGITIHLHDRTIRIIGTGLNSDMDPDRGRGVRLFEGITRHRVPWVREAGRNDVLVSEQGSAAVERIEWAEARS